ncbi:MAG: response regulator transcription factor [Candidatus Loosdrechtia sp.]|uniref:response regulator transcription factor n=1 Tax=Candidatus Loosdrechtia sp. TaxID=3101272 RepID=UPI003A742B73|nr:MAG: LuxR C-terminal-related transcriptional regulator [Candidatus Jettenia sp. AMX2]
MNNNFVENNYENLPPVACIFYRPKTKYAKESLSYSEEVLNIISFSLNPGKHTKVSSSNIITLCLKWTNLLDERLKKPENKNKPVPVADFIDILQSNKRRYTVRGVIMSCDKEGEKQYLFILERLCNDNVNLQKALRQWKLSPREQEIVMLLIDDRCNKEIAKSLNLSINTVKGYLKLLMLKLGVSSRAGIIGRILFGK